MPGSASSPVAEALHRRAAALGALRAHGAHAGFLLAVRGDAAAAGRELREAARHDGPGWQLALGRLLVDDGRAAQARPYVAAASLGADEAVTLLAEIDGEDPYDDRRPRPDVARGPAGRAV